MSPGRERAQISPEGGEPSPDKKGETGDSQRGPEKPLIAGRKGDDPERFEMFRMFTEARIDAVAASIGRLEDRAERASEAALDRVERKLPERLGARVRALRERIRERRSLDTAWRVGVFTLGSTLVLAGAIMFVFPGPGFATVILGLVVLATEFAWASRALDPVKAAAQRAAESAKDPYRRRLALIGAGVLGICAAGVLTWYLSRFGASLLPIYDLMSRLRATVTGWFEG